MKRYLVLIAATAALGGLLFGFDTAVVAGTLASLEKYFQLDSLALGLLVSSAALGCVPGALLSGRLADKFGRKKMMVVTALLFIISAIGCGFAGGYVHLLSFRFVGGLAIGMASAVTPIYISEIAPPNFRGRLGMLQQLAIVAGILLAFISNYLIANAGFTWITGQNEWRFMLASAAIPSVLFLSLLSLIPESPRWLISRGKTARAETILGRILDASGARLEVEQIQAFHRRSEGQSRFPDIFSPVYKKVVWIGVLFASIAQLTGVNIILYYAPTIFERTQVGSNALFQTILTGVVNFLFTILALALIDRIGRKKLLLIGSAGMAIFMFVIGYLFYAEKLDTYWILVFILAYIGLFACTWGAVLWVYVAEMFSNKIRAQATSFAVFGNWVMNAVVSFTFPWLLSELGAGATFFLYGIINLIILLFVSRFIFETKGVPLEEIEGLY